MKPRIDTILATDVFTISREHCFGLVQQLGMYKLLLRQTYPLDKIIDILKRVNYKIDDLNRRSVDYLR